MYLHAGNNKVVRTKNILGIFDMDSATMSKITNNYLKKAEKEGRIINIKEEIPRSFIVSSKKGEKDIIYISQISSGSLVMRNKF